MKRHDGKPLEPIISIVVAVYNVIDYIEGCVCSLVEQSYENIDIVLVDDGSTDGSGDMCDRYAVGDKRIRVLHKENGGLSQARNYGTACALGDLVVYVDGDDIVSARFVELLAQPLLAGAADMSVCDFKMGPSQSEYIEFDRRMQHEPDVEVLDAPIALSNAYKAKGMDLSAWGKLAPKIVWMNNPFPNGRVYEDLATVPAILFSVDKVAHVKSDLYGQITRVGSITRTESVSPQQFKDYYLACSDASKAIGDHCERSLKQAAEVRTLITYARMKHLYRIVEPRDNECEQLYRSLCYGLRKRAIWASLLKDVPLKARANIVLSAFLPRVHKYFYDSLQRRKYR